MDEFIARASPWRIVLLSLGCLLFVAVGLWMAGVFDEPPKLRRLSTQSGVMLGWIVVAFFGLAFVANARQLFEEPELVVLNAQGLKSAQWSAQTIPWTEIEDVSTWSYRSAAWPFRGVTFIILHLRNPGLFPGQGMRGRLASANRKLTGGELAIAMTSTDKSVEETLDAIRFFRSHVT